MNLNAAVEALDNVRFFNCRMADMEGVEPSSSFSCETEGLRSTHPVILFRITGWLNHARSGQTLLYWPQRSAGFGVAQTPTVKRKD